MYFNEQNTEGYSLEELREANNAVRDAINQRLDDGEDIDDKVIDGIMEEYFNEFMR